jgi:transcriptional regulator with XRE-family HTH domain
VKMSGEDSGAHAGQSIGRTLELARKERGLSLEQVEQATKIRARYLRELERENFGVLPAVYVRGSLKTYANFLQLDAEALSRELRRRQTLRGEPQYVEPPRRDYFDRSLIFLGGAAGAGREGTIEKKEEAGTASSSAGGNRIYLASAALLVLVAVALALTIPSVGQPAVSQVREPLVSQGPSQMYRVASEENGRTRPQEDDESDRRRPKQRSGAFDEDAVQTRTGQNGSGEHLAQGLRPATATPRASPAARKEPATAEPEATVTPPSGGVPDRVNVAGAPVKGAGRVPPPNARGPREPSDAAHGPRGGGDFNVRVVVGSDDLIRITGDPANGR